MNGNSSRELDITGDIVTFLSSPPLLTMGTRSVTVCLGFNMGDSNTPD